MTGIDFDFARYIGERQGAAAQRVRDGSAYGYAGERKVRRTLSSARPVVMALEATTRLWKNVAKTELLGAATKVSDEEYPRLYTAVQQASAALRMQSPPVYAVAKSSSIATCNTLGTNEDAYIFINAAAVDQLDDIELCAMFGHELGHVQNDHVLYATALHYLSEAAAMFVRWAVQPAIMTLRAWSRRAEITCDRAALLCTKDVDKTLSALVKLALGFERARQIDIDDYLKRSPEAKRGVERYTELFRSHPYLPKRIQALRLFADSAFYRSFTGESGQGAAKTSEIDTQVADILSVF